MPSCAIKINKQVADSKLPEYAKAIYSKDYAELFETSKDPIEKITVSKKKRRFYLALHKLSDEAMPDITKEFIDAIDNIRSDAKLRDVQRALERGDIPRLLVVLGIDNLDRELEGFVTRLRTLFQSSSTLLRGSLPESISAQMRFDLLNPRAVENLRQFGGQLITGLTDKTRQGILDTIETAFRKGGSPAQQAREIRNSIGLTPRQTAAVENFRSMLVAEGVKPALLEKRVAKFYRRQLNFRAKVIARTETIRASNAGQREIWNQAADQGLLNPNTVRRGWVVTPDDRLCPICEPIPSMNPDGVPLNGTFNTPIGAVIGPPAHPNCRCAEAIVKF